MSIGDWRLPVPHAANSGLSSAQCCGSGAAFVAPVHFVLDRTSRAFDRLLRGSRCRNHALPDGFALEAIWVADTRLPSIYAATGWRRGLAWRGRFGGSCAIDWSIAVRSASASRAAAFASAVAGLRSSPLRPACTGSAVFAASAAFCGSPWPASAPSLSGCSLRRLCSGAGRGPSLFGFAIGQREMGRGGLLRNRRAAGFLEQPLLQRPRRGERRQLDLIEIDPAQLGAVAAVEHARQRDDRALAALEAGECARAVVQHTGVRRALLIGEYLARPGLDAASLRAAGSRCPGRANARRRLRRHSTHLAAVRQRRHEPTRAAQSRLNSTHAELSVLDPCSHISARRTPRSLRRLLCPEQARLAYNERFRRAHIKPSLAKRLRQWTTSASTT